MEPKKKKILKVHYVRISHLSNSYNKRLGSKLLE